MFSVNSAYLAQTATASVISKERVNSDRRKTLPTISTTPDRLLGGLHSIPRTPLNILSLQLDWRNGSFTMWTLEAFKVSDLVSSFSVASGAGPNAKTDPSLLCNAAR